MILEIIPFIFLEQFLHIQPWKTQAFQRYFRSGTGHGWVSVYTEKEHTSPKRKGHGYFYLQVIYLQFACSFGSRFDLLFQLVSYKKWNRLNRRDIWHILLQITGHLVLRTFSWQVGDVGSVLSGTDRTWIQSSTSLVNILIPGLLGEILLPPFVFLAFITSILCKAVQLCVMKEKKSLFNQSLSYFSVL